MYKRQYLNGIPADSRAAGASVFLRESSVTGEVIAKVTKLNEIAKERDQSLAQMALVWALQQSRLTSVLIGASRPGQVAENVAALKNTEFTEEEMKRIEAILSE